MPEGAEGRDPPAAALGPLPTGGAGPPGRDRGLWSPGRIGALELPHRIVMGAMHLGREHLDDGGAALCAFYLERVRGGAGLIVTGGAAVSEVGAGGRSYGILSRREDLDRLGRVAEAVHHAGGLIALQLFHAGRYAFPDAFGHRPVAPSPVYSRFSRCEPAELTEAGIEATIEDFAAGAASARALGFDAVEVMASEGYLIDQFLSPLTNRRDDAWGGDARRRARFGVEVTRAVLAAAGPGLPVILRISGADLLEGGTPPEEVDDFARSLVGAGAEAIDVGIGWHESPVPTTQTVVPPGRFASVARRVKAAVGDVPVIAGTRVNRLDRAESFLEASGADFLSMARPFLADPELVAKARDGRRINICIACNQACIDRSIADGEVSCMVNPRAGREAELRRRRRADAPGRLAVVGAGPAGLSAACELAEAGHEVELWEAAGSLGGQFRWASMVPGKQDYAETVAYYAGELRRLGVVLRMERRAGAADAELLGAFDAVVVASGTRPRPLELAGSDLPHVLAYPDAFAGGVLGERVVVVGGGGVAIDVAHLAAQGSDGRRPAGRRVTVVHRGTRLGERLGRSSRWALLAELRRLEVEVVGGATYERIAEDGVHVVDSSGLRRVLAADTVVVAVGQEPERSVAPWLEASGRPHVVVGGARDVAGLDAVRAFAEGLEAARALSSRLGA